MDLMDLVDTADDDVQHHDYVELEVPMGGLLHPNVGVAGRNAITLDSIRDGIVSESTTRSYIADIMYFLFWCRSFAIRCLTTHMILLCDLFVDEHPGQDVRFVISATKERFKTILREARTTPLVRFKYLTADQYMLFVSTLRKRDGNYLSKSSYNLKKSALSHLFRCHNSVGFSEIYKKQLLLVVV